MKAERNGHGMWLQRARLDGVLPRAKVLPKQLGSGPIKILA